MRWLFNLVLLGCLMPGIATATIYKWIDEQGMVHYGDNPTRQAEEIFVDQTPENSLKGDDAQDTDDEDDMVKKTEVDVEYNRNFQDNPTEAELRERAKTDKSIIIGPPAGQLGREREYNKEVDPNFSFEDEPLSGDGE